MLFKNQVDAVEVATLYLYYLVPVLLVLYRNMYHLYTAVDAPARVVTRIEMIAV